jgi:hypothetical protein
MANHTVKQGECLSSIAAKYGFGGWKALYEHPSNAALKQKRSNPHMLFPGDVVAIPEKQKKQASVKTGASLKLSVSVPKRELNLTLSGPDGAVLANEPYSVEGEDVFLAGQTDGSGKLSIQLPALVPSVVIDAGGHCWEVKLGALNPTESTADQGVSGAQARLRNLGFNPGPADGELGPRTCGALQAFERKNGLDVTGKPEGKTLEKLKELHGC